MNEAGCVAGSGSSSSKGKKRKIKVNDMYVMRGKETNSFLRFSFDFLYLLLIRRLHYTNMILTFLF